jgi:hypothetical protein
MDQPLVVSVPRVEIIDALTDSLGRRFKLTKQEFQAFERLLDTVDDAGLLDRRHEKKVEWWAAVWPSRLIKAMERGLRSTEAASDSPVELRHDTSDEDAVRMVEGWANRMTRAGKRMVSLWLREVS